MAPENAFVKNFILNQLEIKKNNIYRLFAAQIKAAQSQTQVQAKLQGIRAI